MAFIVTYQIFINCWLYLLQDWSRWEANCDRLSRLLDDVEGFVSSGETEGDGEMLAQYKLDSCQVNHVTLCARASFYHQTFPSAHLIPFSYFEYLLLILHSIHPVLIPPQNCFHCLFFANTQVCMSKKAPKASCQ